jgi:hypothetical protein
VRRSGLSCRRRQPTAEGALSSDRGGGPFSASGGAALGLAQLLPRRADQLALCWRERGARAAAEARIAAQLEAHLRRRRRGWRRRRRRRSRRRMRRRSGRRRKRRRRRTREGQGPG